MFYLVVFRSKNQEEHHTTKSYLEELNELLKEHGIEYDERYFM